MPAPVGALSPLAVRFNEALGATLHGIVLGCGGKCSKSHSVGQLRQGKGAAGGTLEAI